MPWKDGRTQADFFPDISSSKLEVPPAFPSRASVCFCHCGFHIHCQSCAPHGKRSGSTKNASHLPVNWETKTFLFLVKSGQAVVLNRGFHSAKYPGRKLYLSGKALEHRLDFKFAMHSTALWNWGLNTKQSIFHFQSITLHYPGDLFALVI